MASWSTRGLHFHHESCIAIIIAVSVVISKQQKFTMIHISIATCSKILIINALN